MKKTSLYLEPEVDAALARIAGKNGITKAELIRRSLRDVADGEDRPRLTAIGVGRGCRDRSPWPRQPCHQPSTACMESWAPKAAAPAPYSIIGTAIKLPSIV